MKTPTLEEVRAYCEERRNGIDPEAFFYFYEANGWVQGKARKPIKNWKACVITWEKGDRKAMQIVPSSKLDPSIQGFTKRLYDTSWAD